MVQRGRGLVTSASNYYLAHLTQSAQISRSEFIPQSCSANKGHNVSIACHPLTTAARLSLRTKPIIAPRNADTVTGKCWLWGKCPHDDNIHCGVTIIPDSSFSYTAVVCVFLACSLSAPAILSQPPARLSIFPLSCFLPLRPASANPTSQTLYPRNLMEVIWLPINGADRGKTPGQCTTVPIMLNTGCIERKPAGLQTVW